MLDENILDDVFIFEGRRQEIDSMLLINNLSIDFYIIADLKDEYSPSAFPIVWFTKVFAALFQERIEGACPS